MANLSDDYPKVGRTSNPKVRTWNLLHDPTGLNHFDFFIINKQNYFIHNTDPTRLFDLRKISDIGKLQEYLRLFAKANMREIANVAELSDQVDGAEAKEVLAQLGYRTRADIAETLPMLESEAIDEICERYGIR